MLFRSKSLRSDFLATNNEAKYESLLIGMAMVQRMGEKSIKVFSDSRLIVGQEKGEFEAKDERLQGVKLNVYGQSLIFLTYYISPEMVMHMLVFYLCLQLPRRKICLELFLLRTCTNP